MEIGAGTRAQVCLSLAQGKVDIDMIKHYPQISQSLP
jgi:hypothetical protein